MAGSTPQTPTPPRHPTPTSQPNSPVVGVEAERRGGASLPAKLGFPLQFKAAPPLILLALSLIVITPNAAAATFGETFEDDATFGNPTADWYTIGNGSPNGYVVANPTPANTWLGDQVFEQQATTTRSFFSFVDGDICDLPSATFSFAFVPVIQGAGVSTYYGFTVGGSGENMILDNPAAGFRISNTGAVDTFANSNTIDDTATLIPGLTMVAGNWYNATMTTTGCTGLTVSIVDTAGVVRSVSNTWAAGTTSGLDSFETAGSSGGGNSFSQYLDNLQLNNGLTGSALFCSNPNESNFGYEYVEGTTFQEDLTTTAFIGLDSAFKFEGDSTDSDYLAKGLNVGTKGLAVKMKLEAAPEGEQSIFRAAFTLGNGGTPAVGNKGDGTDGGNFDDHVGVRFFEGLTSWEIGIYENVAGAGYTRIGSAVNYGDPDNPTNFNFTADTVTRLATLYDENQNIILQRTISSSFLNQLWEDQWFVGTGTALANSVTYLDNNDQSDNDDSTCLFDLRGGGVVTGSSGLEPGSFVVDAPTPETSEGFADLSESFGSVFGGIGATGGAVMLGIFWILIFAAGAYGILGGSPLAIGIGALCGFVFSIFTGLIPDILVFVVVLLAGAAVGMRLFAGGGSGADG